MIVAVNTRAMRIAIARIVDAKMKVKPNENYELLGTSIKLDKNKVYAAVPATNQPNYKAMGMVFVGDILLVKGEYKVVKK